MKQTANINMKLPKRKKVVKELEDSFKDQQVKRSKIEEAADAQMRNEYILNALLAMATKENYDYERVYRIVSDTVKKLSGNNGFGDKPSAKK
jgi:hypothetical protein